jgi:tetratricopeptide (TPR) repeat protein
MRAVLLLLPAIALLNPVPCAAVELVTGDPWIQVETEHFTLLSNAGHRTTIQIGDQLEQLWQVMAATFVDVASRPPTWIYVFRDKKTIAPFTVGADGRPDSIAGYYIATPFANYLVIDAAEQEPFRAVAHEFVHYFIHNNLPYVPLWLNEGLAEYYSTIRLARERADLGLSIDEHRHWLKQHSHIPLHQLFLIDRESAEYEHGVNRGSFYAQSWALTHYLISLPNKRRMPDFLGEFQRGATSDEALRAAFHLESPALERSLTAIYASERPLSSHKWWFADWKLEPAVSKSLDRGSVLFHLGNLLTHREPVQFDSAQEYLQSALAADSSRAEVYASLGRLFHKAARYPESHALYEQAVQMDPNDAASRLGFALSLLEENFATDSSLSAAATPPLLLQARDVLLPLIENATLSIEDDITYGQTFLLDRESVSEGIDALTPVVSRLPWRFDAVSCLIALTAHSGDVEGARSLLEKSLRHRGPAELVRRAEMVIADQAIRSATILAGEGRSAEAKQLLEQTIAQTQDKEVRRMVEWSLAPLEGELKSPFVREGDGH